MLLQFLLGHPEAKGWKGWRNFGQALRWDRTLRKMVHKLKLSKRQIFSRMKQVHDCMHTDLLFTTRHAGGKTMLNEKSSRALLPALLLACLWLPSRPPANNSSRHCAHWCSSTPRWAVCARTK